MLVLAADSEFCAATEILFLRHIGCSFVNPHIEHVYARFVFPVIAADIGHGAVRLHHHSDAVKLGMTGVKDVARSHCSRPSRRSTCRKQR